MPNTYHGRIPIIRSLFVALLVTIAFPWNAAHAATHAELKLWVVQVTTEGREKPLYGKGLEAIRGVLSALPHDTYKKIGAAKHPLAEKGNTRITISKAYTLEAAPPVSNSDGRQRLRLRILMKTDDKPPKEVAAISTELLLIPDKHVLVRGLKQKNGTELVLVLSLRVPKDS